MATTTQPNGDASAAPVRPEIPEAVRKIWAQREKIMAGLETKSPKVDFGQDYDLGPIKGKTVLITGGATGIGLGITEALGEAGAYVVMADIQEEVAAKVEKDLTGKGYNVKFVKTDVTDWDSLVSAFKATLAFSPNQTIDVVIPNAGLASGGNWSWLAETPVNDKGDPVPVSTKIVDVNYVAVYNTAHLAIYYFKKNPGPNKSLSKQIVFVASMAGYSNMHGVLDYGSSKWAVRGLWRTLKDMPLFLGDDMPPFRTNLIAPSWVRTAMTAGIVDTLKNAGQTVAEVSDVVHVALRMIADEQVRSRACVILANKSSFDLCDDPHGGDASREIQSPAHRRLFSDRADPEEEIAEQADKSGAVP